MSVSSFISGQIRSDAPDRKRTSPQNRVEARITDLVATGRTAAHSAAARARSQSKRVLERGLGECDHRIDTVGERLLEELRLQRELAIERSDAELSNSEMGVALRDALGRYDPDEDELPEVLLETVAEHDDVTVPVADESRRDSTLKRYGLDAAYLNSGIFDRLRERRGFESDVPDHPLGPTLALLAPILAQYESRPPESDFSAAIRFLLDALSTALEDYEPNVDGSRNVGSMVSTALERALGQYETDGTDLSNPTSKALGVLFIANLVAMGLGAWKSRRNAPPIPETIEDENGETLVTDDQIRDGKKAFQANGLMNQGSILGNGAYFGTDLTADALELKAERMRDYYARERGVSSFEGLDADKQVIVRARVERELDEASGPTARYSPAEADAHRHIRQEYVERYHEGDPERGIPVGFVDTEAQARRIADFALWTAWIAHADRPGTDHSSFVFS